MLSKYAFLTGDGIYHVSTDDEWATAVLRARAPGGATFTTKRTEDGDTVTSANIKSDTTTVTVMAELLSILTWPKAPKPDPSGCGFLFARPGRLFEKWAMSRFGEADGTDELHRVRGKDRRHPGVRRMCEAVPWQELVPMLCSAGIPVKIGRFGHSWNSDGLPEEVKDAIDSVMTGGITRAEWSEFLDQWRIDHPGTLAEPVTPPKMKPLKLEWWCYHERGELRRRTRKGKDKPPCAVLQCLACGSFLGHDWTKTDAEIATLPPEVKRENPSPAPPPAGEAR